MPRFMGGLSLSRPPIGRFSPRRLAGLQLWLDPYDLDTLSRRYVTKFDGATGYLSRAGVASDPLDLHSTDGTGTQCTIAFWIYINAYPSVQTQLAGKSNDAFTSGAYQINLGSDGKIRFNEYSNAGAAVSTQSSSNAIPLRSWALVVVTFDYTLTNTSRGKIWIGTAPSNTAVAALTPTTFAVNSATTNFFQAGAGLNFRCGYGGATYTQFFNGRLADVAIWKRRLSDAEITALWNGGYGVPLADLGTANAPVNAPAADYLAAWPMTETTSTRFDLSANALNLTANGTLARIQQVKSWQDKSPNGLLMLAANGPYGSVQRYRAREPRYEPDWFGPGLPAVVLDNEAGLGTQGLYCGFADNSWNRFDTGNFFSKRQVLDPTPAGLHELFGLVMGDDQRNANNYAAARYFLDIIGSPGEAVGNNAFVGSWRTRCDQGTGSGGSGAVYDFGKATGSQGSWPMFPGSMYTAGTATIPVTHFREWSALGATPGNGAIPGDWYSWLNGQPQTLDIGLGGSYIGWTRMLDYVNYLALGSIHTTDTAFTPNYQRLNYANGDARQAFGDHVMFGPTLASAQRAEMRQWLAGR